MRNYLPERSNPPFRWLGSFNAVLAPLFGTTGQKVSFNGSSAKKASLAALNQDYASFSVGSRSGPPAIKFTKTNNFFNSLSNQFHI
jgi:hypothetical protein